jgi:hypothetical protein
MKPSTPPLYRSCGHEADAVTGMCPLVTLPAANVIGPCTYGRLGWRMAASTARHFGSPENMGM